MTEPTSAAVPCLLPLAPAPFSVRLERREGDDGGFVTLGAPGRTRCYLARLCGAGGAVVQRLVLQLAADEPPADAFPEVSPPIANPAWEEVMAAARRDLAKLAGAQRFFPELLAPEAEPDSPVDACLPPLLYCPVPERFFVPPCPECFAGLATCRDDRLLAEAGLPLFSATRQQVLYCPACVAAGREARFWSLTPEAVEVRGDTAVGDIAALRKELAAAVGAAQRGQHELPEAWRVPCATCDHAGPCLGVSSDGDEEKDAAGDAYWEVFTAHDTPYVVARYAPWSFTAFAELLGGRPAAELGLAEQLPEGGGLLFASEGSGLDAVEVLALKLRLFLQLLRAVREYHRLLGAPHLNLHPDQAQVTLEGGDGLPYLWTFQLKLLGTSSARRHPLVEGLDVVLPPPYLRMPFFSPAVRDFWLIMPRPGTLIVDKLAEEKKTQGRWRLHGRLVDPQGVFPTPGPRDWLLLTWKDAILGADVHRAVARAEPGGRAGEVGVVSEPLALDAAQAKRLQNVSGLQVPRVEYKVYPGFDAADDLYSLGMLLLRLLVVNDGQDLASVAAVVTAGFQAPAQIGTGVLKGPNPLTAAHVAAILADHQELFAKTNLFFNEVDRSAERPNSVPDELWREALVLALSLVAQTGGGPDLALGRIELEQAAAQVERILANLHASLFQREAVHVEIQSVIAELLADAGAQTVSG